MLYLLIKAALSGLIVAIVSEVARKYPGWGALIVSLPLVSILAMIWLWRDTHDPVRLANHAEATFWFVLPSLPMFLLIPGLMRRGIGFWPCLMAGCAATVLLYLATVWALNRAGVRL
jgi:hypothetical protein